MTSLGTPFGLELIPRIETGDGGFRLRAAGRVASATSDASPNIFYDRTDDPVRTWLALYPELGGG